ncbi:O-methyltransferase [Aestuariimicrobium ganziense]|uniref:O-methyltransferase n=1 Tax=Aestuariimicrobium ganziense TaxID=2773677 RepID=UPI001941A8E2|nr:O-methyltransferase [Aestuariimicrobium ganziense]
MTAVDARSWGFAEDFVELDEHLIAAREESAALGLPPTSAGTLSALTFVAKAIDARHVVEIGTGAGACGLALFKGMASDGVITSIDSEADRQASARKLFTAAGLPSNRFRLIAGDALEVLPKLRDGAYDLVLIDGDKLEYPEYVAQALRLLRHGGVVVLNQVLWGGAVADPDNEDDEAVILREALQSVIDTEHFTASLLPVGDGLLVAVKD